MSIGLIFVVIIVGYLSSLVAYAILYLIIDSIVDFDYEIWSEYEPGSSKFFIWPILIYDLFKYIYDSINNYLTKNDLKKMNFKVLGKAMGFMFLPTLGVLLMLLVGFFDPVSMWTWIKSASGWAVFTRIFIFILETGLVTILYFEYLEKDNKEKARESEGAESPSRISSSRYINQLWLDASNEYTFTVSKTKDPNIVIVERKQSSN